MRKVIVLLHSSLDGFVEGPKGDMDIQWVSYDKEMEMNSKEILSNVDTVLWGTKTYLGMKQYWTTVPTLPSPSPFELEHSKWLDRTTKVIFSRSLESVEWVNARLVRQNAVEEIKKLKQEPGKDMIILGSPRFAHHLQQNGLIDEYQITISPVLLGKGLPLFQGIQDKIKLRLLGNKTFRSGALALHYQVETNNN